MDVKILVAEDKEMFRRIIVDHILKEYFSKCTIIEAEDGAKALDAIRTSQEAFQLIITDNQMPRVKGIDLAKEIRKMEQYKDVPIIIFTNDDLGQVYKEAGINYFVSKQYDGFRGLSDIIMKVFPKN